MAGGAYLGSYFASVQRAPKDDDDFGPVGDFALTERSGRELYLTILTGVLALAALELVFTRLWTAP